jgi:hypothetical protein
LKHVAVYYTREQDEHFTFRKAYEELRLALVQKSGHNMAASEIVIRDGGISERVMSDVWEVTW